MTVVNAHAQFDSVNGYPYIETKVNTRSDLTEMLGTNGVHPSNTGYWQISDALFRAILCN
nr:MAG TPA: GDSL-esterase, psychrotrophic, monoethylphosphonate, HYDROLASE.35A [Caudoviricetes sp.]